MMNNQAGFIANWIAEQNLAIEEDIAEASKLPKGHFFKAAYELPNKQGTVRFTSKGRSMTAPTTLWVMGPKDKEYEEYKEYKNMAAAKKEYDRMKSDALKEELDLFEGGTYDFDAAEYKKHGVIQVIEEVLLNEAKQKVVVYDNGGKSMDRYTVFITYATGDTIAFGMSDNPMSPNGFNQYVGVAPREISPGKHQGKKLRRIPKEIEKAVKERMMESVVDEELSPDEIAKEQSTAIDQFNNDMAKKFPKEKFTARAGVAPMGGGITFLFAVIPTKDAKGVDLLNAPAHSKFIMHLTDNANKAVPMSKFSIEHLMGRLPAKFRKITGKSPTDAVKKLVDWFKKNKSGFEGLVKEEIEEGVRGPTRMDVQKHFDKEKGLLRARINATEKALKISDMKVDAKGTVQSFKDQGLLIKEEVELDEGQLSLFEPNTVWGKHCAALLKIYKKNKDRNAPPIENHWQLAKAFGTPKEQKRFMAILKRNKKLSQTSDMYDQEHTSEKDNKWMEKKSETYYKEMIKAIKATKEEVELDEEFKEKDFDSLKKGDIITIEFDAPMSSGTSKFKVTAKNIVGKAKVHKATLQNVKNPRSVKFFLYKRGNKVTLAQGDMAASVVKYTVEEVEIDESTKEYAKFLDKIAVELDEALKPKDKKVIDAFYDKKKLEGKLLSTDGDKLEKLGMGRDTVAGWKGHKIEITSSSAVKSDDVILRYMKKSIPKLNFDPKSYKKYFGEEIEKTYIGVDFMKINQHQFLNPLAPSSMWPLGEED